MATAYVTEATVKTRLGEHATTMLDWDGDGSEDTGLLADLIDEAGAMIDARLAQKLSVPFAAIDDTPDTPDIIQRIALYIVLWYIADKWEPEGRDASTYFDRADQMLTGILEGRMDVHGHARQKGYAAGTIAVYDSGTPTYGGEDSDGVDRTRGI